MIRRHPIACVVTALLLATAFWPLPPIMDAATESAPGDAELALPFGYLVLAPLSNVLDGLTFLGIERARWALGVWALALGAWGAWRPMPLRRRIGRALVGPIVLLALVSSAVVLPRPVPRLVAADAGVTVLDYHAHTEASHDGRAGWTVARLADWHARQGFEASYVTDHNVVFARTVPGPILLLPGAEWSVHRQHVLSLGPVQLERQAYARSTERMLGVFAELDRQGAVGIASIPEYFRNYRDSLAAFVAAGVDGFEIVNCSPKALAFPRLERRQVLRLAVRHDLLVVGGSDNHGWGAVTCVWNLSVAGATGYRANRVIARPLAVFQGQGAAWAAPVTQVWLLFRSLSWSERISWLTWIALILIYRTVPRREGQDAGLGILARSLKFRNPFRREPPAGAA